jgi:hypothetical protein
MQAVSAANSGASYDRIEPPQSENDAEGDIEIDISGDPAEDTVEFGNPASSTITYGPNAMGDRFRFDLANGMLNGQGRFRAVVNQSRGAAVQTYEERRSIEANLGRGLGASHSALFSLQMANADPNREEAGSQAEARASFARNASQNIELLNLL